MAKQKFSIDDIAAQSERRVVADQLPRDPVKVSAPVVADQLPRGNKVADQAPRVEIHVAPDQVPRGQVPVAVPAGFRVRQRIEKPHVSVYAHPVALETVRQLARAQGRKAHEIYVEGLRMVLAKYGYDFDKLDRGEPPV